MAFRALVWAAWKMDLAWLISVGGSVIGPLKKVVAVRGFLISPRIWVSWEDLEMGSVESPAPAKFWPAWMPEMPDLVWASWVEMPRWEPIEMLWKEMNGSQVAGWCCPKARPVKTDLKPLAKGFWARREEVWRAIPEATPLAVLLVRRVSGSEEMAGVWSEDGGESGSDQNWEVAKMRMRREMKTRGQLSFSKKVGLWSKRSLSNLAWVSSRFLAWVLMVLVISCLSQLVCQLVLVCQKLWGWEHLGIFWDQNQIVF